MSLNKTIVLNFSGHNHNSNAAEKDIEIDYKELFWQRYNIMLLFRVVCFPFRTKYEFCPYQLFVHSNVQFSAHRTNLFSHQTVFERVQMPTHKMPAEINFAFILSSACFGEHHANWVMFSAFCHLMLEHIRWRERWYEK